MRGVLLGLCVFWTACKLDPDDGQFRCPDGVCPEGQFCNADELCVDMLGDASLPDATADSEIDAGDDAMVDAPLDVDRPDSTDGGADETCDPDGDGFARDENADGSFDEGCPWAFGRAHPVTSAHTSRFNHFSPQLSADGRTLYFAHSATPGGGVFKSTRTALDQPFGPAELMLDEPVDAVAVYTEDEYYVQIAGQIHPVLDGALQSAIDLGIDGLTGAFHPSISRDGLDLFVAADVDGNRNILLARRNNTTEPFSLFTQVFSGPQRDEFPTISHDRLTLFMLRDFALHVSTRTGRTTTVFTAPTPFEGLPVGARQPHYQPDTREMFFVREGSPDWAPASISMWRVQACRSGACDEPMIDCTDGTRSEDAFHCYTHAPAAVTHASIDCGSGFAATIHSIAERDVLRSLLSDDEPRWLGGRRVAGMDLWDTAEPITYSELDIAAPNGCFGYRETDPRWITLDCDQDHAVLCETEIWPTWVTP